MGWLKALLLLAWAFVRTVTLRLFGGGRKGLEKFRRNYADDGLAPVSPAEREQIAGFGRCIACGLCDRGETRRIVQSEGAYPGLMALVLSASRSMPDYRAAALGFDWVPEAVLAEKERICPTRVPFRQLAAFVHNKAALGRVSLPVARNAERFPTPAPHRR